MTLHYESESHLELCGTIIIKEFRNQRTSYSEYEKIKILSESESQSEGFVHFLIVLLLACNAQPMDHIWSLSVCLSVCFIYLM